MQKLFLTYGDIYMITSDSLTSFENVPVVTFSGEILVVL